MNKNNTNIILSIVALIILGFIAFFALNEKPPLPSTSNETPVSNEEEVAISALVTEFGSKLKNISLLMSPTDVRNQMQEHYGKYLTSELLAEWQADPGKAIGRSVSSPWPEKINIMGITKQDETTYKVEGNVIEVASASSTTTSETEIAAVYPVTLIVIKDGDRWLISGIEKGAYSEIPHSITVTGFWECLPHKDTTGPQTEECAMGLAVDQSDGHFALDLSLYQDLEMSFQTGMKVKVTGTMVPANQLSSNHWQKYPIDGIIQVKSVEKIEAN